MVRSFQNFKPFTFYLWPVVSNAELSIFFLFISTEKLLNQTDEL